MQENNIDDSLCIPEHILEHMSPEERAYFEENPEALKIAMMQRELSIYQGPLPSPEVLKGYGEIDPSLPDRIVSMAENQSMHRQDIERKVVNANIKNESRGS